MSASSGASRRTVTVLFCDVVDSTPLGEALDAETLRRAQTEYFDAVREVLERHGGTVEKFIGDAVMAVFGLPTLHEDDALRALRAASELRVAIAPLDRRLADDHGLRWRIRVGVATGEVVAGDSEDAQSFATGGTVVVAQRLESSAHPSEVLLDDATYRLTAGAALVEPVDPVPAKGKAEPVPAWRLIGVQAGVPGVPRRLDTPLVGRREELARLREAYAQAVTERRCRLVTVIGPAGIGKSRLVREFLVQMAPEATIRVGRCPPYGDGVTFWPVVEVLPDETLEGTTEEIFRRVRKSLEEVALERPLVVCLDDLHWAEPTFLDLVDYLRGLITDAPVLIVGMSRAEVLEERPQWAADTVVLTPLSSEEAEALLSELDAPGEARLRITEAAEGNPLFAEQMAAMAAEEGPSFSIPASIKALLAARLDRLPAEERTVIERAAVIGREFPLRAVAALAPEELRPEATGHVLALVRKELVEPYPWAFVAEEDGFRFRHGLIREAAYEGIRKELRAALHEQYAGWFERYSGEDVIVGYHVEQAYRLREQLGNRIPDLARKAGALLGEAGRRAYRRGDMPAARNLLGRAAGLLADDDPSRLDLQRTLANALWTLAEVDQADAMLRDVLDAAARTGDRRTEWYARLDRVQRSGTGAELVGVAEEAARVFEELGEEAGISRARRALAVSALRRGAFGEAEAQADIALRHAEAAGDDNERARAADAFCTALLFGPSEAASAAARCRALLEIGADNALLAAHVRASLAGLEAMRARFEEARQEYRGARVLYEDLGLTMALLGLTQVVGSVELLAGEAEAAEAVLREGLEIVRSSGATGFLAPQASLLALALLALGRQDEAEPLIAAAERSLADRDLTAEILTRTTRAMLELAGDRTAEAEEAALAAIRVAEGTDALNHTADAYLALALARRGGGSAFDRALELYTAKGNVAGVERARRLVAKVTAPM